MKVYSYLRRAILRELCEDSRASVTAIAKKLNCSRNTVLSNIRELEREFGLSYTLEFDRASLHTNFAQVWYVRFGNKPTTEELRKIFSDDYRVRFVSETEGDFDLIIYVASDIGSRYLNWSVRTIAKLLPYRPKFMPSTIIMSHTGFFKLRKELLDTQDLSYMGLDALDKRILMVLNENSRMSYLDIAKAVKANVETVRYRMNNILRQGIIRRFTTMLKNPPLEYNAAFFINSETLANGVRGRYTNAMKYYINVDEKMPLINSFQYIGLMSGSHTVFGVGCFDSEEAAIKKVVMAHREIYKEDNPKIEYAKIKNVIKGSMPMRNMDLAKDYRQIDWNQERY